MVPSAGQASPISLVVGRKNQQQRSRRFWWTCAVAGVIVAAALALILRPHTSDFDDFWQPVLDAQSAPVLSPVLLAWQHPRVAELSRARGYPFAGQCATQPTSQKANRAHDPEKTNLSFGSNILTVNDPASCSHPLDFARLDQPAFIAIVE